MILHPHRHLPLSKLLSHRFQKSGTYGGVRNMGGNEGFMSFLGKVFPYVTKDMRWFYVTRFECFPLRPKIRTRPVTGFYY